MGRLVMSRRRWVTTVTGHATQDGHRLAAELLAEVAPALCADNRSTAILAPAVTPYAEHGWSGTMLAVGLQVAVRHLPDPPPDVDPLGRILSLLPFVRVRKLAELKAWLARQAEPVPDPLDRADDHHVVAVETAAAQRRARELAARDQRTGAQPTLTGAGWREVARRVTAELAERSRARAAGVDVGEPNWKDAAEATAVEVGANPFLGRQVYDALRRTR